jgi:3-oxoacyl-ACP reductase-like protein
MLPGPVLRALIPLVLVLASAAVAAGCGGSGGSGGGGGTTTAPSTPATKQFAAKVTQMCAASKKKIAKVDLSIGSMGSVSNSGQEVADLEGDLVEELQTLQPPDEIKSQFDDFVSKVDTARNKLADLVHAAKNFQADNVKKLTPEVTSAGADVHFAAKSFGASC